LVATLTFSLEAAVLGGVTASLVTYLYRSARPSLRTMGFDKPFADDERRPFVIVDGAPAGTLPECPQFKLLRMEGSVYFGAVAHVAEHLHMLRTLPEPAKRLMVMTKGMTTIDLAGAEMWESELLRRRAMGGELYFHRPRPQVLEVWARSGFIDRLGADHIFASKRVAIATIVPQLEDDICARCTARVFDECRQRPGADAFAAAQDRGAGSQP
jgi:SulP family sulfate permease